MTLVSGTQVSAVKIREGFKARSEDVYVVCLETADTHTHTHTGTVIQRHTHTKALTHTHTHTDTHRNRN